MTDQLQEGMLWQGDDLDAALAVYRRKYGEPTLVHVHPETTKNVGDITKDIGVLEDKRVQPGYYWIGRSFAKEAEHEQRD